MKSATVFLVALTVSFTLFLESSTAAVDSTTREAVQVNESVKRFLDKAVSLNERLATDAIEYVDENILTAKGKAKKSLIQVSVWLKLALEVVQVLHFEMNVALNSGSSVALEIVSTQLSVSLAAIKAQWPPLRESLPNGEVKEELNKRANIIFANSDVIDAALKGVSCSAK
ncbi:uncharacterized protein LOC123879390 [Maniola jurtina]|uniref:uncharacterized protein LOC123879390 n=1 Tax=Maniola jurtina TaxID=191418 RepID=UPI001E68C31F|nr:uncharacterized protein LOC123879390 [Maniola jurtina]